MDHYVNAFEISPVPVPGGKAPERFEGIYGMPSFVTIPTTDLTSSVEFWTRGLDFFELFTIPDRLVHLRRWAFQDVLLVPASAVPEEVMAMTVSFACVLDQIDDLVDSSRAAGAAAVAGPRDTPWGTRDVEVVTPERVKVVFTAAMPYDPAGEVARNLGEIGIAPQTAREDGDRD